MRAEKYEYTCDNCGDAEADDIDELPLDWTEVDGEHFCERCS